jgi:hypothetical protein
MVALGLATSGIFVVAAGISALWGWSAYAAARRHETARAEEAAAATTPALTRS